MQETFTNRLARKFVKSGVIQSYLNSDLGIQDINISREIQKDDEDLAVGLLTHSSIQHLLDEGSVSPYESDKFYDGARNFFRDST